MNSMNSINAKKQREINPDKCEIVPGGDDTELILYVHDV